VIAIRSAMRSARSCLFDGVWHGTDEEEVKHTSIGIVTDTSVSRNANAAGRG